MKQTILYLPVVHAGYEAFLQRHADSDEILVLGRRFRDVFPKLAKEIRALSPERAVEHARLIVPDTRVLLVEPDELADVVRADVVVLPDEEIMHRLTELPDFPGKATQLRFETTFLRWDREWSRATKPVRFDYRISRASLDRRFMVRSERESRRSSDWWRQVGAVAVREGEILKVAHNHHHPTEYAPYIDGDPRNDFSRGLRPDLSTAIHAEASLVAAAARDGLGLAGADLYVSTFPCPACARLVVEAGFQRCFFAGPYSMLDGDEILRSGGVELVWVDMAPDADDAPVAPAHSGNATDSAGSSSDPAPK
ncbi:deaminase [Streptomyces sp. WI04-05B]|uniref:deaminase n=1 Tax=Streptomyces TaxID=1883 RepID=UPI0029A850C4|nr:MULTISPECIES: deaminase [unclassified Streptomyces]MDX2543196.1 deaminase [Streptomyces sp. WI04-05B]MDX2584763.1 deaminase [Streptomyces sp. WI04-05A]MDX3752730.1 deaminase [Streptomyces sp. AK08-02]